MKDKIECHQRVQYNTQIFTFVIRRKLLSVLGINVPCNLQYCKSMPIWLPDA